MALAFAGGGVAVAQVSRVYIAPDDHTDYFWTADEATYGQVFLDTLDYYLAQADATDGNPSDLQGRWNCDGSFWMWSYERNRTASDFSRLIGRIRDGHVSVPLNALAISIGATPAEAVLRGMYYPGRVERRYDVRFPLAYTMENQTQALGVASLWAGAGARYSWKGVCGCDSPVNDAWDREHDIYWATGLDGNRVLMKWNSQLTLNNQAMGGYAEARDTPGVVDYVTDQAAANGFLARYPYGVVGCFGKGWDDLETLTDEFTLVARDKTRPDRRVRVSNEIDFFEDFAATYPADSLPSVSASFGNDWELYQASLQEESARVKRAVEKLRAAEALATVASLGNPCFMTGREAARDQAFMDLGLYYEHDFGMNIREGAIVAERIAWQKRLVSEIEGYVDGLYADAAADLGGMISGSSAATRFFVFNPLGWTRTDAADLPYVAAGPVHVVDISTGADVPSQTVSLDGSAALRILATDVPSVGYKVYEVRSGLGTTQFQDAATVNGNVLDNGRYSVAVSDRGSISSWIDQSRGGVELVRNVLNRDMNDLGPGAGQLTVENRGPVSVTLAASSPDPYQHTSRITLLSGVDRIDIRDEVTDAYLRENVEWGFGFNSGAPDVWHEEVGAILHAKLTTDGGHYSPRNARYDGMTLNHFADVGGGAVGFTLSNADASFMRVGESYQQTFDGATPILRVLGAYYRGLPDQGGDRRFLYRFALRSRDAYDPVAAMKFALEHQNPLVAGAVTGGGTLPAGSWSLASVSSPAVILWALKPAEEGIGRGIVTRLWNVSALAQAASIRFAAGPATGSSLVTHIETPIGPARVASDGSIPVSLRPQEMTTVIARLDVSTPSPSPNLSVSKSGGSVVLSWSSTGQGCYSLIRSKDRFLGGAERVYEGPQTQSTDPGAADTRPITYYSVE